MLKNILKKIIKFFTVFLFSVVILSCIFYINSLPEENLAWGINFSTAAARGLGFEPVNLLEQIFSDLKPKYIRLNTYWNEIEAEQSVFNFTETDKLLNLADKNNANVILVVGLKQPRWPECHTPAWWQNLNETQKTSALENMLTKTVQHFSSHSSVKTWQVENEPLFNFGLNCPTQTLSGLKKEVSLVKELDTRPVIVTDSGEKSSWLISSWSGADILGSTMYREAYYEKYKRYVKYHLPAFSYNIKAGMVKIFTPVRSVIGVELQAEPWFNGSPHDTPVNEQLKLMNPEIFANNVAYAKKVGFEQNYFWGVEWWYWLKSRGNDSMVEAAKKIFK